MSNARAAARRLASGRERVPLSLEDAMNALSIDVARRATAKPVDLRNRAQRRADVKMLRRRNDGSPKTFQNNLNSQMRKELQDIAEAIKKAGNSEDV